MQIFPRLLFTKYYYVCDVPTDLSAPTRQGLGELGTCSVLTAGGITDVRRLGATVRVLSSPSLAMMTTMIIMMGLHGR